MVSKTLATPAPLARSLARGTETWATGLSGLNGSRSVWVSITSGANRRIASVNRSTVPSSILKGWSPRSQHSKRAPPPGLLFRLLVPSPLHVLDRLVRLVPKVSRRAPLTVRERYTRPSSPHDVRPHPPPSTRNRLECTPTIGSFLQAITRPRLSAQPSFRPCPRTLLKNVDTRCQRN